MDTLTALSYLDRLRAQFIQTNGRSPSKEEEDQLQEQMLEVYNENLDSEDSL